MTTGPPTDFTLNPALQEFASKMAGLCARYLDESFGIQADYSDTSTTGVENALSRLWEQIPVARPSPKEVEDFATLFGSYLGETYRRNHGGEWGVTPHGEALRTRNGILCYPWNRAYKRLTNGPEDNVRDWYVVLVQQSGGGPPPLPKSPPPLPPGSF